MNNIGFRYTQASILAIVGALLSVLVTFGVHVSQNNIDSILTLVGVIAAAVTVGGGFKTAGLIAAGQPVNLSWHFTPALVVSLIGATLALALSFGLDVSQTNIDAIMHLVELVAGGLVVGGGIKSSALLRHGKHPALHARG